MKSKKYNDLLKEGKISKEMDNFIKIMDKYQDLSTKMISNILNKSNIDKKEYSKKFIEQF